MSLPTMYPMCIVTFQSFSKMKTFLIITDPIFKNPFVWLCLSWLTSMFWDSFVNQGKKTISLWISFFVTSGCVSMFYCFAKYDDLCSRTLSLSNPIIYLFIYSSLTDQLERIWIVYVHWGAALQYVWLWDKITGGICGGETRHWWEDWLSIK